MSLKKRGSIIYLKNGSHTYCYDESEPVLGEGAMGIVYKGYELETRKVVAIKRVKDKYSGLPEIRRRARLEASLMFSHPNLVEMYGCCEVAPDRGPLFIISGYIEGENIDRFIDRNIMFQFPSCLGCIKLYSSEEYHSHGYQTIKHNG